MTATIPAPSFTDAPPCDIEAEKAVLGAMMMDPGMHAEILGTLTARAFYRPAHQIIFAALEALAADGITADAHTVRARLENDGSASTTGGPAYLIDLLDSVAAPANAPYHAAILLDLQAQRDLQLAGARIAQIATEPGLERQERLDKAAAAMDGVGAIPGAELAVEAATVATEFLASLERDPDTTPGVRLPWADLQDTIPGLRPGEIAIVGARPGVGKSLALLAIAANAAIRDGLSVLAVTLEMSREEYMERLFAAEGRITLDRLRKRDLGPGDWDRLARAHAAVSGSGLLIQDRAPMTVPGLRSELRAMRRAGRPADLVVIDYLQLMSGTSRRAESRQAEVSEVSRGVKLLAKEFAVPIVVAAQLNRESEQRSDHRPLMSDLRESGSAENDADIVVLLYREDEYDPESPHAGEIDFIVRKNRQGPKTTVTAAFLGHYAQIADMARVPWTPSGQAVA